MSRRLLAIVALFLAGLAGGLFLWAVSRLPRMVRQATVRPFERQMPPMPAGAVPQGGGNPTPSAEVAASLTNPLPDTAANRHLGRLYYGYNCAPCHGADGRSNSVVGASYHPKPTDLTTPAVQQQPDGLLYRQMVVGLGHEPSLAAQVPLERRWLIVRHVRSLASRPLPIAPPSAPAP